MKVMLRCLLLLPFLPLFPYFCVWIECQKRWSARVAVVYHRWVRGRYLPLNGRSLSLNDKRCLLQPVRFRTPTLHSFHSYCFVIKKGTKISVKQSSKMGLKLWLIPGYLSVVWWLCSFHGWRLFRQKKSKCRILTISIAIESDVIKMCFKHY